MNRRAFFGAFGVLLAAPAAAMATRFAPDVQPLRHTVRGFDADWGEYWETPNGETITGMKTIGDRLFVFTQSSVFEARTP